MAEFIDEGPAGGQPVGQLPPQDWMTAAETKAVIAALAAKGAEVRFVGGCVRDALLGRPIRDIDIATHDPPETVIALLAEAGIRAIPTGIAHGTVTAVVGRAHFEITTLRDDVETFGRHARVAFTADWTSDAARRDFTINAMCLRPEDGMIFDPFDGLADLGARRVRFVGDPVRRIEEDVLRLLRFFRFYAHYGRPPPDKAALAACRAQAHKLKSLSGERIAGELLKLLQAADPTDVLLLMRGERVLEEILPEAVHFGRLRVLCFLESRGILRPGITPDPLRRLAALIMTDRDGALALGERLKFSNAQTDRLAAMAAPIAWPQAGMEPKSARRLLYRTGVGLFRDLTLIAWAESRAIRGRPDARDSAAWLSLLDEADGWRPVELPVQGRDVLALGLAQGPRVGALLAQVEAWWIEMDFQPDRQAALAYLRQAAATPISPSDP